MLWKFCDFGAYGNIPQSHCLGRVAERESWCPQVSLTSFRKQSCRSNSFNWLNIVYQKIKSAQSTNNFSSSLKVTYMSKKVETLITALKMATMIVTSLHIWKILDLGGLMCIKSVRLFIRMYFKITLGIWSLYHNCHSCLNFRFKNFLSFNIYIC